MFWVVKILTTAAGEAVSDYLSTGNKAVGALVEIAVFVVALIAESSTRRYFAPAYWPWPCHRHRRNGRRPTRCT